MRRPSYSTARPPNPSGEAFSPLCPPRASPCAEAGPTAGLTEPLPALRPPGSCAALAKQVYTRKEGVGDGQRAWSREVASLGAATPKLGAPAPAPASPPPAAAPTAPQAAGPSFLVSSWLRGNPEVARATRILTGAPCSARDGYRTQARPSRQHLLGRTGPPSSSRGALATAPVAGHHQLRGRQRDAPSCGTPEVNGPTQGRAARSPAHPPGRVLGGGRGGPVAALPATLWSWSRSLPGGACPVRMPRGLCPRIRTLKAWRRTPSS